MDKKVGNRAERRQLDKKVALLKTPKGQEVTALVVEHAVHVLHRDFGFGKKRIDRFISGMLGENKDG